MSGKKMKKILIMTMALLSLPSVATELVYTPVNPSFGGNPLNGSFLLNKAQAQNGHTAPIPETSYADRFQESLERAYISQIVREITDTAFGGESDFFNGNAVFQSGDYEIMVITDSVDSITVQISNLVNNEVTVIEVPRFQ